MGRNIPCRRLCLREVWLAGVLLRGASRGVLHLAPGFAGERSARLCEPGEGEITCTTRQARRAPRPPSPAARRLAATSPPPRGRGVARRSSSKRHEPRRVTPRPRLCGGEVGEALRAG